MYCETPKKRNIHDVDDGGGARQHMIQIDNNGTHNKQNIGSQVVAGHQSTNTIEGPCEKRGDDR